MNLPHLCSSMIAIRKLHKTDCAHLLPFTGQGCTHCNVKHNLIFDWSSSMRFFCRKEVEWFTKTLCWLASIWILVYTRNYIKIASWIFSLWWQQTFAQWMQNMFGFVQAFLATLHAGCHLLLIGSTTWLLFRHLNRCTELFPSTYPTTRWSSFQQLPHHLLVHCAFQWLSEQGR